MILERQFAPVVGQMSNLFQIFVSKGTFSKGSHRKLSHAHLYCHHELSFSINCFTEGQSLPLHTSGSASIAP